MKNQTNGKPKQITTHTTLIKLTCLLAKNHETLSGRTLDEICKFAISAIPDEYMHSRAIASAAKEVGIKIKKPQKAAPGTYKKRASHTRELARLVVSIVSELEEKLGLTGDERLGCSGKNRTRELLELLAGTRKEPTDQAAEQAGDTQSTDIA